MSIKRPKISNKRRKKEATAILHFLHVRGAKESFLFSPLGSVHLRTEENEHIPTQESSLHLPFFCGQYLS